ncbi:hypothetical protein NQ314_013661 [Rhamnusium bicolor]|uniref:Uncharacterized protein n=1 Tax=Rhamnusium bicolor TaxID=1586634 RepID=A0AAV8X6C5_9CUCU|nr:hypothetical protein NQ314_013661 [Rhamnusium bicolor]
MAIEEAKRYQNDLAMLEYKVEELEQGQEQTAIDKLMEDIKEKDLKIDELCKERLHLQELLNEKDKIINQISEDSHKLHVNLVTIQTKLKETGNIIDLGKKLKEEQKRTADLLEEIHELKAQLMQYEITKKNIQMTNSVDEITDQLKRELDYSAQIDSNIICAVSDQSLSSISESQDMEIYKKALAKEKSSRKQLAQRQEQLKNQIIKLEEKCGSLQLFNNELQCSLENERLVLHQTQAEDAKLIEQMRIQLDTVLDNEEALGKLLDDEKAARKQLQEELEVLKKKPTNSSSASKTDSTEYKALPSKEAIELNQLRKDFEVLHEENSKLSNELKLLNQTKSELENDHKYTKDMLSLEIQKAKNLEEKVQELVRNERELRESLLQKKDELEQEKAHLNKQKHELMQLLKMQTPNEPQKPASAVPDVLLNKIKELNNALLDNKKLVDLIQRISNEKRNLESEILDIKGRKTAHLPFNDLVARSDYLFAKTLKLESTKKALIWQKRYLLDYLRGHQHHCVIEALPEAIQYRGNLKIKLLPRVRFRWHSGVRIAEKVNSRHYKHLQTRTESSVPTQFHVGQPVSSQLFSNATGGHFNTIGPKNVFNLNQEDLQDNAFGFYDGRLSPASSREDAPWSGSTPPSKEGRGRNRIRIGSNVLYSEDMTPLKAPQLLAQFVERFDQIQEKLGVVLNTNTT